MNEEQLTSAIREVLLKHWDPCGVGDNEALRGEYDSYIPDLASLIANREPRERLLQLLTTFESDLGISMPESVHETTIEALPGLNTGDS